MLRGRTTLIENAVSEEKNRKDHINFRGATANLLDMNIMLDYLNIQELTEFKCEIKKA